MERERSIMDSNSKNDREAGSVDEQLLIDFPPFLRVYKDGRFDRFVKVQWVPPTTAAVNDPDHTEAVLSKDVLISSETGVSARLFLPKEAALAVKEEKQLLPLLIYIHGGAYCVESAFSSIFHSYVSSLVSEAKVVALSVDYRITPEHPITACYDDSWATIQWAVAHYKGNGPEPWLNRHVDFKRVFFAGDSAGGNIASNMAWRARPGGEGGGGLVKEDCNATTLVGIALIHPFFGVDDKLNPLWELYCPDSGGIADPRLNPILHRDVLTGLGCKRVLVCVAEKDEFGLRERGVSYYEALKKSGWKGKAELVETPGETHDFHLFDPDKEKARQLLKKVASFLNET